MSSQFECLICREQSETFLCLPCDHKYCAECLKTSFGMAATGNGDVSRLVCPTPECRLSLASPQFMPILKNLLEEKEYEGVLEVLNNHALRSPDYYSCPKCDTKGFRHKDAISPQGTRVKCSKCLFEFCSECCSNLYHYNLPTGPNKDCKTVMREKEAAWLSFRAEALGKVLGERATQNAAYKKDLQKFNKEQKERKKTLQAFKMDEEAKKTHVHCPKCNALWIGSDACPQVTCGVLEKAMGEIRGVVGCGHEFRLTDAKTYTPATPPTVQQLSKPLPKEEVCHNMSCSRCSKSICGIRFRCLNCPNYNLCLSCLAKHGQGHKQEKCWPKKNHIFDVIYAPYQHASSSIANGPDEGEMLELGLRHAIDGLDEEEMLELALRFSLDPDLAAEPQRPAKRKANVLDDDEMLEIGVCLSLENEENISNLSL